MTITEKLKASGLRPTAQRVAILRALEMCDHPRVEEVYHAVREDSVSISFATVYKALRAFGDAGLIRGIATGDNLIRYDCNPNPHYHCTCRLCGRVWDIFDHIDCAAQLLGQAGGFFVESADIVLNGHCDRCVL